MQIGAATQAEAGFSYVSGFCFCGVFLRVHPLHPKINGVAAPNPVVAEFAARRF